MSGLTRINKLIISLLIIFVSGCAHQQHVNVTSKQARINYLTNMQNWQLKGRVAVRQDNESHSASIIWDQSVGSYKIYLSNPLAAQVLTVTPDNIKETFLYDLPTTQLKYWLIGLPSPATASKLAQYDANNLLVKLSQDGWDIEYLAYMPVTPIMLPNKIIAHKDEMQIKIVINCWDR